jgi:23S rRNA pseudouridine2605 synthase
MASGKKKAGGASAGAASERLHKYLASTGAGSRRECEEFIKQGRVTVNGKQVTKMGVQVVPGKDVVTFDGEKVRPERKVYFLLNKPPGYICTNADERGRPRAMDLMPDKRQRVYTVGRLDADSRGLILLTNDGTIANIVCHPRYRVEKVYEVAVRGRVSRAHVSRLEAGVWLAEGKSSPARVRPLGFDPKRDESRLAMTLFEGRNREIRRVFAKVGLKVKRLRRTRIGPLELEDLAEGACRALAPTDLRFVYEAERLYEANRELWDAELPPEPPRGRRKRGPRPKGGPRAPRTGGKPSRPSRPAGEKPKPTPRRRRRYYP